MEARSRVVIAAVGLAALILTALLWSDRDASANRIATPDEPTETASEAATAAARTETEASVPVETAPPRRTVAPSLDLRLATLRGRCVDEHGEPLAGCTVSLHGFRANAQRMDAWSKDHAEPPEWKDPPDVTTTQDGMFAFAFWPPPPFQFALHIELHGRAGVHGRWSTIDEGAAHDLGDVALLPGVRVRGRVLDEMGVPKADVRVNMLYQQVGDRDGDLRPHWSASDTTRRDGTFAMRDWVLPGAYSLSTSQAELQTPKAVQLTAERSEEVIEIVVRERTAQHSITGRVVDETGAPVRGIDIENRVEGDWVRTSSRGDGVFELRKRVPGVHQNASLVLVSHEYEVEPTPREVPWGTSDLELRVQRAPSLTLRVTDPHGAPIDTYLVRMIPRNRGRTSSSDSDARTKGQHENGMVVVPGLTRGDWLLVVELPAALGFADAFVEFTQESGPRRIDLTVEPLMRRPLRVLSSDGPVAGTKVQLCDTFGTALPEVRRVLQFENWLMNAGSRHGLVVFEGTTDAEGRVVLAGPHGRELGLLVLGNDHLPVRQAPIRLDVAEDLVVHVERGATIAGKVGPPEAIEQLKRLARGEPDKAFPSRYVPTLSLTNERGEAFPNDPIIAASKPNLRLDDDNAFRVEGLPPGRWRVQLNYWVAHEGGAGSRHHVGGEVTLVDAAETRLDLDLANLSPGEVEGTVTWNGRPFANGTFTLVNQQDAYDVNTDAEGHFRTHIVPGTYEAVMWRSFEASVQCRLVCPTSVKVLRGQLSTIGFAFESAEVRITLRNAKGELAAGLPIHVHRQGRTDTVVQTGENGVARLELDTGNVEFRMLPKSLSTSEALQSLYSDGRARGVEDPLASHWIPLQSLTVTAGQVAELELRLPASAGY